MSEKAQTEKAQAEKTLTDGTTLVCMGALHAGVDYFVGYPITPASGILSGMVDHGVGIEAPDEITVLQYLIGSSLNGHKVMTATSGPGFLLMAEGIGAAFMMQVPMVVTLVQRLGPATGSATANAQGDIAMAENVVSGGYLLPMLCPPSVEECAATTVHAVNIAETFRTPVILISEMNMMVGKRAVDLADISLPPALSREQYTGNPDEYRSYKFLNELDIPLFKPLGNQESQVRITASTHDENGQIAALTPKVRNNLTRLMLGSELSHFPKAFVDAQEGAEGLIITFGFTTYSAKEAVRNLRKNGKKISLISLRTLFPVLADDLKQHLKGVRRIVVVEENQKGIYRKVLLGEDVFRDTTVEKIIGVNSVGRAITPADIEKAVVG